MSSTPERIPEGLKRIFAKKKFDPQNLLRKEGTNIQDINRLILQLNSFAEETSASMKQSVYENYSVFIEAAKDVAVLESDMHQMHHLLNEQKRLLQNLQERSIFGNSTAYGDSETVQSPSSVEGGNRDSTGSAGVAEEEDKKNSRKNLASLLESTEGAIFIADVPGRRLEFEGDLVELNPENFSTLHRVHAFLLNDSLVIAKHLPTRRGPLRYRHDQLYELTSLAVVDCKARRQPTKPPAGPQKVQGVQLRQPHHHPAAPGPEELSSGQESMRGLAFTLMRFPDTRVLAAETAKLKRKWMDGLDRVKRRRAAEDSKKRESTLILAAPSPGRADSEPDSSASPVLSIAGPEGGGRSPAKKVSDASGDRSGSGDTAASSGSSSSGGGAAAAQWLEERLEDLDVAIAEHNFGQAVGLIELLRRGAADGGREVAPVRLDDRVKQLTDLLVRQLQPPENAGGVSGPTLRVRASVQTACRHLVRLGRWALACPLLLRYRSAWISAHLDAVRQEGSQLLYAKKLCAVFFHTLLSTAKEYEGLFEQFPATFTAYCRWCQQEVAAFTADRLRPVLDNRSVPFHVMCQAMQVARKHAEMYSLADGAGGVGVGVDLVFFFEEALLESWLGAVREQSRVLQEAVEHRHGAGSGERWRHIRLHTEKERHALLAQMGVAGLASRVAARLGSSGRLNLADHTCQFARSLCQLAGGLGHLGCRELSPVGAAALAAVMNAEGRHYRRCLAAEQYFEKPGAAAEEQRPFILENLKFLLDDVLPVVEERIPPGTADLPAYRAAKADWQKMYAQSQAVSV